MFFDFFFVKSKFSFNALDTMRQKHLLETINDAVRNSDKKVTMVVLNIKMVKD